MRKGILFGGIAVAIVVIAIAVKFFMPSAGIGGVEVDWRLLGELDYITGKASSELTTLNGHKVKIPGFMVPLEDDERQVVEFLLVPSAQACIHVPPPPPNQMVYVKMAKGHKVMMGPIWVYGTLNLVTKRSMYGDASFEFIADRIEPYK